MQIRCKTNVFERLQVEGVNEKRCPENIKIDVKNHTKINRKTMLDFGLTNDDNINGKGYKMEAKRAPTNDE